MDKSFEDYIKEVGGQGPLSDKGFLEYIEETLSRTGDATAHALGLNSSEFPVNIGIADMINNTTPIPTNLTAPPAAYVKIKPGQKQTKEETIAIARWMASVAIRNGLPPELPVMASLVESSLRNLTYGDADSEGFFQIRVGIHGRQTVETPEAQLAWFIRVAKASPNSRKGRKNKWTTAFFLQQIDDGRRTGSDAILSEWLGRWCADIERPRESLEYRYKDRYVEAKKLLYGS